MYLYIYIGIGKSSAWVLALNDHEWGRGKWIINFDDADSTKQVWLDNWASSIGYDMLSRNMKVGHMLRGILSKNIAGCCEGIYIYIYIYIYHSKYIT